MAGGGLDAGEVYVVVGAHIDTAAFAKADAAMRSTVRASNDYSASIKRGEVASKKLGESLDRAKSSAIFAAKATAVGFGGAAAALAGTVVAAAGFDSAMRNVNSIAGLSEKGLKGLEGQLLALAPAVGKTPTDLANGLYDIVSSGFKAADAIKILKTSAVAATAGMTDTATASGAIVGALNSFHIPAADANKVASDLFETVKQGVVSFPQLAQQMGDLTGLAPTLGVSLQEVTGSFALLTTLGGPAAERSTQIKAVMSSLLKPSKDLSKAMKEVGVANGEAGVKAFGFAGFLEKLKVATHGNTNEITKMFPNVRALAGFLGLTGSNAKKVAEFIAASNKAYKDGNEQTKAFAEQSKSTSVQFDKLKSSVSAAAIIIGSALLPQVNAGIGALSKWLAAAQKSGDLSRWAQDISHYVTEVIQYLHSLTPEAQAVFHALVGIVQTVVPPFLDVVHAIQDVEPEIKKVAGAFHTLASALGTGPILASIAAFVALRKATQAGQVAVGVFAKVMAAGQTSIAGSAGGIAAEGGKFTKVGQDAVNASGVAKIAARGIASAFGPQLIAVGAAGIILGFLAIRKTMTSLKDEANDVVNAMLKITDLRLARSNAALDVKVAQRDVDKARANAGSAAVAVRDAQDAARGHGGHPGMPDPGVARALQHQSDVILDLQQKTNRLTAAQKDLLKSNHDLNQGSIDLGKQIKGFNDEATGKVRSAIAAKQWGGQTRDAYKEAAQAADLWAKSISEQARKADGATKASVKTADGIAAIAREMGHVPTPKEQTIIVNGLKAGRTVKQIRDAVLKLEALNPVIPVAADPTEANKDIDDVTRKANAINALHPVVTIDAKEAPNSVTTALASINSKILGFKASPFVIPVTYATPRPPTGGSALTNRRIKGYDKFGNPIYAAAGHKTKKGQPELAVIGEGAGPEYVIPTEPAHRAGGIQLWLQAARDLGIPGFKAGVKKPGKTPPPIQHGLGYDPAALDTQKTNEQQRLDQARTYRDQLAQKTKTDSDHKKTLEKEKATAETAAKSKNKKTAAAAKVRVTNLAKQIAAMETKIANDQAAHKRQVDVVIPRDTKRYEQATAAARIGDAHAAKITLWQDRADADTNAMDLAANEWNQADRKKDQKGRDAAYRRWDTARKARGADLGHVRDLLKEVLKVVGLTDYGAKIKGQLSGVLNDISTAADDANAPDYVAPQDPQPASTQLADYLNPWETDVQSAYDQDSARASTTDDLGDDILAAQQQLNLAKEIEGRLEAAGAPTDIITQALQGVKSAQDALSSAVQATTPQQTQDAADQLAQQKVISDNATKTAAASEAALRTFAESGDLFRGQGITVNVGVRALTADSTDVQRSVGSEVVKALGSQPYVPTSTGYYRG